MISHTCVIYIAWKLQAKVTELSADNDAFLIQAREILQKFQEREMNRKKGNFSQVEVVDDVESKRSPAPKSDPPPKLPVRGSAAAIVKQKLQKPPDPRSVVKPKAMPQQPPAQKGKARATPADAVPPAVPDAAVSGLKRKNQREPSVPRKMTKK